MNLILFNKKELDPENRLVLNDRRHDHIVGVLKRRVGETVRLGQINGPVGTGKITATDKRSTTLEVELSEIPPLPRTDLILALPRPIMLKKVLAQAASLGVHRIFLINARRVEKSFFHASLLQNNSYQPYLLNGLEQAMDTRVPEVSIHSRFRPFIEDVLPAVAPDAAIKLVAHPGSNRLLCEQSTIPRGDGKVFLAIGPEGGWIDFEVDLFKTQGFLPFSMGPRVLRVDTAVPALLAQLDLLRRRRV